MSKMKSKTKSKIKRSSQSKRNQNHKAKNGQVTTFHQANKLFDTLIVDKGKIRGKGTEKFGDF